MENQENEFVTKKIEQPILGSQIKDQIKSETQNYTAVENGFYQTNKYYIWAIAAGLAIILFLGYLAFKKPSEVTVKEASVEVQIKAPEKIPSGGDTVFTFNLKNTDSQKFTKVRL